MDVNLQLRQHEQVERMRPFPFRVREIPTREVPGYCYP